MNPQAGYYQNSQPRQSTYGSGGSCVGGSCRLGGRPNPSTTRIMQPTRSYGYSNDQGMRSRAPPVFPSRSGGNYVSSSRQYPTEPTSWTRSSHGCRMPNQQQQQSGPRPIPFCGNNYKMGYQQPQQCSNQHPLAPAPFCTPQAIKVNVTAEQLQNARSTPYQDRGEPSVEENPGAKYIQLNWQDLLGGMDNLRVSMVPSPDPCNPNQQLKVSFGGQKKDPPQAGETSLKVVSIEPVNTGRMDLQKGNALASSMKICNSPITNVSPTPTKCPPRTQSYANRQGGYGGAYRQ